MFNVLKIDYFNINQSLYYTKYGDRRVGRENKTEQLRLKVNRLMHKTRLDRARQLSSNSSKSREKRSRRRLWYPQKIWPRHSIWWRQPISNALTGRLDSLCASRNGRTRWEFTRHLGIIPRCPRFKRASPSPFDGDGGVKWAGLDWNWTVLIILMNDYGSYQKYRYVKL